MTKSYDVIAIKGRKERAWTHVCDLDSGAREWTMSIPTDVHYDSDELICAALEDIDYLLAESAQRLARIAELETMLDGRMQLTSAASTDGAAALRDDAAVTP